MTLEQGTYYSYKGKGSWTLVKGLPMKKKVKWDKEVTAQRMSLISSFAQFHDL